MNILNQITTGRHARAQKVCIYAPEGFGKSTLAALFPDPLFLDVEDSTSQLAVRRLDRASLHDLKTFESALIGIVASRPCSTLVIDTIDWLEQLALDDIIATANNPKVRGIEDFGYGKGYTILRERLAPVLAKLDAAIAAGIHVVLLAHARTAKFEPPYGAAAHDRYELKLTRHVAPLVKEWADMLLFGNWRAPAIERGGDGSSADGAIFKGGGRRERQMHCNRSSAWDAKNRHGMADVERWDIGVIEWAFRNVGAPWGEPPTAVPVQLPVPRIPPAGAVPVLPPATAAAITMMTMLAGPSPRGGGAPARGAQTSPAKSPTLVLPPLPASIASQFSAARNARTSGASAADAPATLPRPTLHAMPAPGSAMPASHPIDVGALARICAPHAIAINEYLRATHRIKPGEDWHAMPPDFAMRVLRNPSGFLKIALAGKAVAA